MNKYLDYPGLTNLVTNIKTLLGKYATKEDLLTAGKVKTVNSEEPDENGNIDLTPEFNKIETKLAQCIYVKDRHLYLGTEDNEE